MNRHANTTRHTVLTAGYLPLDIVSYRGKVWHAAGGTAGNVAAILGFLGWNASVAANLGDDLAADRVKRDLRKANVSIGLIQTHSGFATPRVIHDIADRGHSYRFTCPQCGLRLPRSRPLSLTAADQVITANPATDVFFFDRVSPGTVKLAEHYAGSGSYVVFEPSRPARSDLMQRAVVAATLVKYADDRDPGLKVGNASSKGRTWIVTRGERGASYKVGEGAWHESPAFSYPVVDAGGAGDWTTAGLIHALPRGTKPKVRDVSDALRWAQALAAVSCGAPGARGLARQQTAETVLQTVQFLNRQGQRPETSLKSSMWPPGVTTKDCCTWCLQSSAGPTRAVRLPVDSKLAKVVENR